MSHIAFDTVQVTMEDAAFSQQANQLELQLTAPHIKGVFEERLPLQWQAALQLGCVVTVAPDSRDRALSEGFAVSELLVSPLDLAIALESEDEQLQSECYDVAAVVQWCCSAIGTNTTMFA